MTIKCCITGKEIVPKLTSTGNIRLPPGWKKRDDQYYSPQGWKKLYAIRAITVPIVSPVVDDMSPEGLKLGWESLRSSLKAAWLLSTDAANWALKTLYANDVSRTAFSEGKCPAMPKIYLYGERSWEGWSQSASAVLQTVEKTYRERRYEINWTRSSGLPLVRYPYPFPIHNSSWDLEQTDGGEIHFNCRLPDGRVKLKLRTKDEGSKYRIQSIKHLLENPHLRSEAAILRKKDGSIHVKLVGWFPVRQQERSGTLFVRTDTSSFLVIVDDKEQKLRIENGDWIRRKLAGHKHALQRWREDQKFECRRPVRSSRKYAEDMKLACDKMHSRLDSFIKESCAHAVNLAVRRKIAKIVLDTSERSYFREFAWHKLETTMKQSCQREGIDFELISKSSEEQKPSCK